jgi:hypothetical protein
MLRMYNLLEAHIATRDKRIRPGDFVLLYEERNPSFYRDGVAGKRGLMPFLIELAPHLRLDVVCREVGAAMELEVFDQLEDAIGSGHGLLWLIYTPMDKKANGGGRASGSNNR